MSSRVDPSLLNELKEFGDINVEACFNCGNCTAACPLTTDTTPFPRDTIRYLQVGLTDELKHSLDPWLCYYCGDCSRTCPRQAEPGEAQMTIRRWLTAQYDWTGLAKRFYTSKSWEIGSIILIGLLVILGFAAFHGPIVTDKVALNTFAPVELIHVLDLVLLLSLSFFLITNILHMYHLTMVKDNPVKIPISIYLSELWQLIFHAGTQNQFSKCDEGDTKRWRNHFLLVTGYVTMFVLVIVFLEWFQTDEIYPIYHPQRWIGYYATVVLIYGASDAIWGRIKKYNQMHRFSHPSDWIFPILLWLTAFSGILLHTFRYIGLPLATYYTYVGHLAIAGPMLILEVPFGKWSHLAYRPFAMYFLAVREKALKTAGSMEPVTLPIGD